jgi:hypothetical protein
LSVQALKIGIMKRTRLRGEGEKGGKERIKRPSRKRKGLGREKGESQRGVKEREGEEGKMEGKRDETERKREDEEKIERKK